MRLVGYVAGGPLIAECDAALADLGRELLVLLAARDRSGLVLVAGSKVQFGWSLLTLIAQDNELHIAAPDYARDPFQDPISVSI